MNQIFNAQPQANLLKRFIYFMQICNLPKNLTICRWLSSYSQIKIVLRKSKTCFLLNTCCNDVNMLLPISDSYSISALHYPGYIDVLIKPKSSMQVSQSSGSLDTWIKFTPGLFKGTSSGNTTFCLSIPSCTVCKCTSKFERKNEPHKSQSFEGAISSSRRATATAHTYILILLRNPTFFLWSREAAVPVKSPDNNWSTLKA